MVLSTAMLPDPALAARAKAKTNDKYSSIVIDAATGAILSQAEPDKILHPASLTKIMTLMLTFEAIDKGKLRPSDRITVSRHAASMSPSKLGLRPGQTIQVQDAISIVVTKSANDIAVALGEAISGSEDDFVQLMNLRARSLGMTRTQFRNASGLPNPGQVSTARDMAKLARYIITTHPRYYPVFAKKSFVYQGRVYANHNHLMKTYPGMDGIKTGYVAASGFNLVASAKRGNQRVIGVVFGGESATSRNVKMASLLDTSFQSMSRNPPKPRLAPVAPAGPAALALAPALAAAGGADPSAIVSVETRRTVAAGGRVIESRPQISTFGQAPAPVPALTPQSLGTVRLSALSPVQTVNPAPSPMAAKGLQTLPSGYATSGTWAVQVGAFQSRLATDQALYKALHQLPPNLSSRATAMIVPLRTADAAWMFRARLSGFSESEAHQACSHLTDCLTISPQAY